MHVRGSSLSHPKVVETLRPFIVSFWGQHDNEPIPADILPLYEASAHGGSNVRCFVLDSKGRLLHSFNGFPANMGNPLGFSTDAYAAYFTGEIHRGSARLVLPKADPGAVRLPEPKDGVRLFIRVPGRRDAYGYPVVETVEDEGEWKTLAYPEVSRKIEASRLSRWLRWCYPPGVNEQLEPFSTVRGTLTLTPAGKDQAVLSGPLRMALSETDYELFEGTIEAVITYGLRLEVRGVVDGIYWRFEPRQNRWAEWRLTAAIESCPK